MFTPAAVFAYALQLADGVGRVTAHRLLKHFDSYEALAAYPREQVLTRMKGAPGAGAILARLFDRGYMQERLERAAGELGNVAQRRVEVVCPRDAAWPPGLNDLAPGERPVLLYAYGDLAILERRSVAFFARPPLAGDPYERAQALAQHLFAEGVVIVTGASHGFDVVMHKLAGASVPPQASAMVLPCGLARLPGPMRLPASTLVKAGGVILSPFAMAHGPFEHDEKERALVQAAVAGACVFVEPRTGTPEWHALEWAVGAGRRVFGIIEDAAGLPEGVKAVGSADGFGLVIDAWTGAK